MPIVTNFLTQFVEKWAWALTGKDLLDPPEILAMVACIDYRFLLRGGGPASHGHIVHIQYSSNILIQPHLLLAACGADYVSIYRASSSEAWLRVDIPCIDIRYTVYC